MRRVLADLLRPAIVFGLASGWLEVGTRIIRRRLDGSLLYQAGHLSWMPSAANAGIFVALALILSILTVRADRKGAVALGIGLFGGLACSDLLMVYRGALAGWSIALVSVGLGAQLIRTVLTGGPGARRLDRAIRAGFVPMAAMVALAPPVVMVTRRITEDAASPSPKAQSRPNVLLLVIDTGRSLNMSVNGYPRPTTPALETLAGDGVRFDAALSPAPWTLPSHASMFTGRWPAELAADWRVPLESDVPTLAEALASAGYHTAGFSANLSYVTRETGLSRGFGHFEGAPISLKQVLMSSRLGRLVATSAPGRRLLGGPPHLHWDRKSAARVNASMLRWIGEDGDQAPWFVFANYFDAHLPYYSPPDLEVSIGSLPGVPFPVRPTPGSGRTSRPEAERAKVDEYDRALAYVDREIGRLVSELDRRGVLEQTVVIVTADHGEEFREHGLQNHGHSLYLPSLQVPLIIRGPDIPSGVVVSDPVSLRDLARTVSEIAGGSGDAELPGESLARFWRDSAANPPDPLYATVRFAANLPAWFPVSKGDMASVVTERFHQIVDGEGTVELYDVVADPWEQHDLASDPGYSELTDSLGEIIEAMPGLDGPEADHPQ